jgi:hypothetical protein
MLILQVMIAPSARTSCSCLGNTQVHLGNVRALLLTHCSLAFLYPHPTESCEMRGSTEALPSKEAGSGAMGCMVAPELFVAGRGVRSHKMCGSSRALPPERRGLEPWDTWQCVDACPARCLDLRLVHGGTRSSG